MPWRLLLLLLFFAAKATGQSVTARCNATIAPNDLATLVTSILDKLGSQSGRLPMFSLAVNIPCDPISNTYDPNRVNLDGVKKALLDCEVDSNRDVVAATLLKWDNVLKYCPDALVPWEDVLINCKKDHITWRYVEKHCPEAVKDHAADHAEYRVLERFQSWAEDGKDALASAAAALGGDGDGKDGNHRYERHSDAGDAHSQKVEPSNRPNASHVQSGCQHPARRNIRHVRSQPSGLGRREESNVELRSLL
ncbi:uncharacterized protein LOC144077128 isoform X2 [Stigmatopora argus]